MCLPAPLFTCSCRCMYAEVLVWILFYPPSGRVCRARMCADVCTIPVSFGRITNRIGQFDADVCWTSTSVVRRMPFFLCHTFDWYRCCRECCIFSMCSERTNLNAYVSAGKCSSTCHACPNFSQNRMHCRIFCRSIQTIEWMWVLSHKQQQRCCVWHGTATHKMMHATMISILSYPQNIQAGHEDNFLWLCERSPGYSYKSIMYYSCEAYLEIWL